jgi:nickel-type superoxide dismutase maturation protease
MRCGLHPSLAAPGRHPVLGHDPDMARLPWFPVAVAGDSMEPTLRPGEWWLARRARRVRVGDVVVVRQPEQGDLLTVKRITRREGSRWWVEGDNAAHSRDSRHYGPVDPEAILARLVIRYRPLPLRRVRRVDG